MSDLEKATAEAMEAARQGEQFAMMLAAVQAAQQTSSQNVCQHQAPVLARQSNAGKWVAAGVGGSVFLLAVAVSAVAVAISAVSLTVCLLVLRSVWKDVRRRKD